MGIGQGLFMSPNSSAVLGSVPGRRVGTASGTLAQMRVTGQALGIALSAAIVATRLPGAPAAGGAPTSAVRATRSRAPSTTRSGSPRRCAPSAS